MVLRSGVVHALAILQNSGGRGSGTPGRGDACLRPLGTAPTDSGIVDMNPVSFGAPLRSHSGQFMRIIVSTI